MRPSRLRSWSSDVRAAGTAAVLLAALDGEAPALAGTLDRTVDQGRSLVDRLALWLAALIALSIGATLAAALTYRHVATRMKS
jgi:hypothetical protein